MKRKISLLFLVLSVSLGLKAEVKKPFESKTIVGKLENGLTYYVRSNKEPKERASFYIIQNVGAVLEKDKQNGLAHFLEHMAFNGTQNFPDKGVISTLEKYGIKFGRNINAYTSFDETVYNIDDVPTTNTQLLDTCLLILHDWSHYLTLDEEEIDAERGVITEEWRTRRNSSFRLSMQTSPVLFKGSIYAERDVIGDLDVIKGFKYDALRDFYHDWYRPDLQAIAVVGDFDAKEMEKKIIARFSSIPKPVRPKARPDIYIPDSKDDRFVVATDKEATQNTIQIITILPTTTLDKSSVEYGRDDLVSTLFGQMVDARIRELMNQRTPPFLGGGIAFSELMRNHDAYYVYAVANEDKEAEALKAILTEEERIARHGFVDGELERVKTSMLASLEAYSKQQDKVNNVSYVDDIKENFLNGKPLIEFDDYYNFVKNELPKITVDDVMTKFKSWDIQKNKVIMVQGSDKVEHLTQEQYNKIRDEVKKDTEILAYRDKEVTKELLDKSRLTGSAIKETKEVKELGATEFTLANGVKVVYRKADYNKDNISLYAYSEGGSSLYRVEDLPNVSNAANFAANYGVGDFDLVSLGKMLTGKVVSVRTSIGGVEETLSGSSTGKDLETMFQLAYLRFTAPRVDEDIFEKIMAQSYDGVEKNMHNPARILGDSLSDIRTNYSERNLHVNKEYLEQLDMNRMNEIYKERFANAADFTFFVVGDVEKDAIVPYIEKYLGSLPTSDKMEKWVDNGVRFPKGKTTKRIDLSLEVPKSTSISIYSKEMPYDIKNAFLNKILSEILTFRYQTNIREKEGGTYGVNVSSGVSRKPIDVYTISMVFDCDPEKAEYLTSLIYKEIESVMTDGITEEELSKVVANIHKNREQAKLNNSYWMNTLVAYYKDGVNNDDPTNYENIIDSITPQMVKDYAKLMFKKYDLIDVIFSPKEEK